MPGVIINGEAVPVPGLAVVNFRDEPSLSLKEGEDCIPRPATRGIRAIVLHSTKGDLGPNLGGLGPPAQAGERCARYWATDARNAGAHLVVDHDGSVACLADLQLVEAYHCPKWNGVSVGIELYQGGGNEMYLGQLEAAVRLLDFLTRRFGIQRQIPHAYVGAVARFLAGEDSQVGAGFVGILGHRDAAKNRGVGDPGNKIFNMLAAAGYEDMNFDLSEDRDIWRQRQRKLGLANADGIPGHETLERLIAAGYPHGMWVRRPGDDAESTTPVA